jgi:hypothetical protein
LLKAVFSGGSADDTYEDDIKDPAESPTVNETGNSHQDPSNSSAKKRKRADDDGEDPVEDSSMGKGITNLFRNLNVNSGRIIKCIDLKKLENFTNMKKDALIYFFLKLEEVCGIDSLILHPISWENCTLRFYRTKMEELKSSSFLIKYASEHAKVFNGSYKINLVKMALELDKNFHQITRELKRVYFENKVFYELEGECICYEIKNFPKDKEYLRIWLELNKIFEIKDRAQTYKMDTLYLILYKTISLGIEYFQRIIERYFDMSGKKRKNHR